MIQDLDGYQRAALRTARSAPGGVLPSQTYLALGLCGECGEVAEIVKKIARHGHGANRARMIEELGDVLWYLAVLAAHEEISLSEIATANDAKLRTRYPDGFVARGDTS